MVAFSARFGLGVVHGANPALTFYPAIIVAAVLLGWTEALLILALSVTVGAYLPPPSDVSATRGMVPGRWTEHRYHRRVEVIG